MSNEPQPSSQPIDSFLPAAQQQPLAMIEASKAREAAEIMATIAIAKRFPRDENSAFTKVMTACKRKSLAELSQYEFSRGGTKITGPSIHLAKVIASAWGNIDVGWRELSRNGGESTLEAYAWDKETNTRHSLTFTQKHWRDTREGGYALKDERDIYELCANQAARRMRACILSITPGDVVDAAIEECDRTLAGPGKEPIGDRIRKMAAAFSELGVTIEMIETLLQCKLAACSESNLSRLRKIFASIRDGVAKVEDHFAKPVPGPKFNDPDDDIPMGETPKPPRRRQEPAPKAEPEPAPTPEPQPEPSQTKTARESVIAALTSAEADAEDFKDYVKIAGLITPEERAAATSYDDLPDSVFEAMAADGSRLLNKFVRTFCKK